MAGIILGALGGMGEAGMKLGMEQMRYSNENDRDVRKAALDKGNAKYSADLSQQKAEALELFKTNLAVKTGDEQRTAQVGRIDTAKRGIVQSAIDSKYAAAVPADPSTWTADQQAAVDKSKGIDAEALSNDPKTGIQAAIKTGDIGPKDAASLNARSDADLTRLMLGDQRAQTMAQIAAGHDDTRKLVAAMMADSRKQGASKEDRVIVHQFLQQFDRKIQTNDAEIRSLRTTLKDALMPEDKAAINDQIGELKRANENLTKAQMEYAKASGVNVPASMETPPPKPAPLGMVEPKSKAEMDKLPSGTKFRAPDGSIRVKP